MDMPDNVIQLILERTKPKDVLAVISLNKRLNAIALNVVKIKAPLSGEMLLATIDAQHIAGVRAVLQGGGAKYLYSVAFWEGPLQFCLKTSKYLEVLLEVLHLPPPTIEGLK